MLSVGVGLFFFFSLREDIYGSSCTFFSQHVTEVQWLTEIKISPPCYPPFRSFTDGENSTQQMPMYSNVKKKKTSKRKTWLYTSRIHCSLLARSRHRVSWSRVWNNLTQAAPPLTLSDAACRRQHPGACQHWLLCRTLADSMHARTNAAPEAGNSGKKHRVNPPLEQNGDMQCTSFSFFFLKNWSWWLSQASLGGIPSIHKTAERLRGLENVKMPILTKWRVANGWNSHFGCTISLSQIPCENLGGSVFSMGLARSSMATGVVCTQLLLFQLCAVVVEWQVSGQRTDGSPTAAQHRNCSWNIFFFLAYHSCSHLFAPSFTLQISEGAYLKADG